MTISGGAGSKQSTANQPIVQLTVPCDRSQVTHNTNNRTTREEYLISGMPTALINHETQVQSAMLGASGAVDVANANAITKPFDHSIDMNFAPEFKETDNVVTSSA